MQSQPYELSSSLHEYPWAVQSSHVPPEHVAGQLVPPLQSVVSVPVVQYVGSSQMPSLAYVHESPLLPPVLPQEEHPVQSQPYVPSSSSHVYEPA